MKTIEEVLAEIERRVVVFELRAAWLVTRSKKNDLRKENLMPKIEILRDLKDWIKSP